MRENLRRARAAAGMTQQRVADELGISLRSYQRLEAGDILGRIPTWDALEDLFGIGQRELRGTTREGGPL